MEKDIEDDGDIVMRTDTCGRDNEPMDKVYKDLMDSSLCLMESMGDEELKGDGFGDPSPEKRYTSKHQQSPELVYVPGHSRVIFYLISLVLIRY